MLDLMKRELEIGQTVIYTQNPYAQLYLGKIHKITPKGVMVERRNPGFMNAKTIFKYGEEVAIIEVQNV